jgi:flagellin-like protein
VAERKGITPVIAVVLLLLITVGAVGAAFGLFQQLQDQARGQTEQLSAAQRAANTEVSFTTVYNANGYMNMTMENTGQRVINMTEELSMFYSNPDSSGRLTPAAFSGGRSFDASECFSQDDLSSNKVGQDGDQTLQLLQGEVLTCNTSVPYPSAGDATELIVTFRPTSDVKAQANCNPQTANSRACYP